MSHTAKLICSAAAAFALSVLGSACSAVSDFDFPFAADDADGGASSSDAGATDAGAAGAAGSSAAGSSGSGDDAGAAGMSGNDKDGGSGSGAKDAGVDAAVAPECSKASDCGSVAIYECLEGVCAEKRLPSSTWQSNGGGITASTNFNVRVSVGAPQPMGIVSSAKYSIVIGPGAGRQ